MLKGDPYQVHVCRTVDAVMDVLDMPELSVVTTYQSRMGPVKWLSPSTSDQIQAAAGEELFFLGDCSDHFCIGSP